MLAHVYLKKGCIVPKHQHENEQLTYILEGALRFWIGEDETEEVVVRAGEVLHIPSNVWHKAEALEDTLDVDIFSPPRAGLAEQDRRLPAEVAHGSRTEEPDRHRRGGEPGPGPRRRRGAGGRGRARW